jgi:pyruvate/2-oxoglutarate dehydrogenase complex dihydrolipoamide acyltransferase (E2) component
MLQRRADGGEHRPQAAVTTTELAAIINYPKAAMLGVGRIIDRPWAHEGQVAPRKVAQL